MTVAWTYVALRALYMFLILGGGGISRDGMNQHLWPSTFRAYARLLYMSIQAVLVL